MSKSSAQVSGVTLAGIEIFTDLTPGERAGVAAQCRRQDYEKDELILSHLDNSSDVFFVISGAVRVTIYSTSGKEITFRDLSSGQIFGELSAIDHRPRSAHVIALMPSSLAFVSANDFWQIMTLYPKVTQNTLRHLTGLVRLLSDRVVEFSTLGVKNRIHAELLRLVKAVNSTDAEIEVFPVPTHTEIANRVSTHREAVAREMSALTRLGIIQKKGNKLIITDVNRLQKMVDDVLRDEQ